MYILNKLKIFSSLLISITLILLFYLSNWQFEKYRYKVCSSIFKNNMQHENYNLKINEKKKIKAIINCNRQNNFLMENQIIKKRLGYNLYTSCSSTDYKKTVLIFRGWVYKKNINKIKNIPNKIIVNMFNSKPINAFEISKYSNEIKQKESTFFIQRFNDRFNKNIIKKNKYFYVKLEKYNKYMYNVITKSKLQIKPIRHFFYSLQWLFFAITLFLLYTKYNNQKRKKNE